LVKTEKVTYDHGENHVFFVIEPLSVVILPAPGGALLSILEL